MPSPFERNINDLGVHSVPPARPKDPRVRLAEEDALQADISAYLVSRSRESRWTRIHCTASQRTLTIEGEYYSRIHPAFRLPVQATINVPEIANSSEIVRREERVYLTLFTAISGAEQDPELGQVSFQYLDRGTNTLTPVQKENAKRDRVYWLVILAQSELTAESFNAALPVEPLIAQQQPRLDGDRFLRVDTVLPSGFPVAGMRVYALDPHLTQGVRYPVKRDFIEVAEVCRIVRSQNFLDRGYTVGRQGEEMFDPQFMVLPVAQAVQEDVDARVLERLMQGVFAGKPGLMACYQRTVQNLTAGLVAGNPGRAGESAASPNGSVCLANDNRISFTNQRIIQTLGVQISTAVNNGSGAAVVTAQLNTNSPPGSVFGEKPSDHKIYKADGTEQSALGKFINLGRNGSLVWTADQNSTIRPGDTVYFVPGIEYPAGSGFDVAFDEVERVWLNGTPLNTANVRTGFCGDLEQYEQPAGNDQFITVWGKERAALHYIYKRVQVSVDANGVAVIPATELGCFAFIEGVEGRIDAPVKTGLTPNTTLNALVYYSPRSTESWQVQFKYCPYQGTGEVEPNFLDGAVIVSKPQCFLTTQGGGNSVFRSESVIRYSPISMHLPSVDAGIPAYRMDAPVRYYNEPNPGPVTFRPGLLLSGQGLTFPNPGTRLTLTANPGLGSGRSLHAVLKSGDQVIGFRTPILHRQVIYQSIIAFMVRKGDQERLVIATFIGNGADNVELDSTKGCAFDTFRI